jgi:hypothetical protein
MDEQSTERWKGEPEPQKSELPTVTENEKRGHGKRSSPRTARDPKRTGRRKGGRR